MGRYELPVCRWRTPGFCPGRQGCTSTIVGSPPFGVPDHICWMCSVANHRDPEARAEPRLDAGGVRHLLYHLYPLGDVWWWNLAQLRQRMSLFNGRRLVSAAIGPGTASIADVAGELRDLDVELHEVPNDAGLREMASYPWLLEQLQGYTSPADCTYYGHAKGVTSEAWGDGVRRWTNSMYEALLDHWPAVRRELRGHCCVGIWRRQWRRAHGGRSDWHYSGSHRWFRNADLYARDWRDMERTWVGSETHPGIVWTLNESACLYGAFASEDLGLYQDCEWRRRAAAERDAWLAGHAHELEQPLLVTVLLGAARQAQLVHEAIASVQAQTTDSWQLLIVDAGELSAAGAYDRYQADARISVMVTGETAGQRAELGIQGWALNEAWRRGRVRGDLVICLSDDDVLDPGWLQACLAAARAEPEQNAWYGPAERWSCPADRPGRLLGRLETWGVAGPGRELRGRVDGMQLCCRRSAWRAWPEDPARRRDADGWWMDAIAASTPVHPLPALVGQHRHTPLSTFTTSAGAGIDV